MPGAGVVGGVLLAEGQGGGDGVHPDPEASEVVRQAAGEVHDGALGGVVGGEPPVAAQPGRGTDVHDGAPGPFQVRQRRPCPEVAGVDVGAHDEPPVVGGGLLELLHHAQTRVGHQHVQAPEPPHGGIDHRLHGLRAGDVGGDRERVLLAQLGRQRVQSVLAPGREHHVRPFLGEPSGEADPDPGAGTGDDHGSSAESLFHARTPHLGMSHSVTLLPSETDVLIVRL